MGALRAVVAAIVTGVSLVLIFTLAGAGQFVPAALFGAIMSMQTAAIFGGPARRKRPSTWPIAVVPVLLAVALSSVVSLATVWSSVLLVVLAVVGVGLGRYGRQWAGLGQLLFLAYYFMLLMHLRPQDFPLYAIGGVIGLGWAMLVNLAAIPDKSSRVLRGGVTAFEQRLAGTLDPVIDAVSWGRWDPDINKRVRDDIRQLLHSAAFLSGQLKGASPDSSLDEDQSGALRQRVFDAELAAVNVAAAARHATGFTIPVAVRATVSGLLERLQRHIRNYPNDPRWLDAVPADEEPESDAGHTVPRTYEPVLTAEAADVAPANWPDPARRLYASIFELLRMMDALHLAQVADLVNPDNSVGTDVDGDDSRQIHAATPAATYGRWAVQAGLSTGLALGIGSLISPSYQYWSVMPAYQVLGESDGETFIKGSQKVIGTVAGAAVGFGIAVYSNNSLLFVIPALLICVFSTSYFASVSAPLMSFWQTMMFAQLYEVLGKLSTETVELRVLETVVGAAVALVVAAVVLPTRTRVKLNLEIAALARTVEEMAATGLQSLSGERPHVRQDLEAALARLNAQAGKVNATAAPLRRSSGAMESGGIEARLTAVWSLVYYSRHLMTAVEHSAGSAVAYTGLDWENTTAALKDNFAALQRVLTGEAPGNLHEDLELPVDTDLRDAAGEIAVSSVKFLDRINQTVLVLIANVAPDESLARPVKEPAFIA